MNIVATQFDLPHNSYEFYVAGCNFHCKNCQNKELWNFNQGIPWKQFLQERNIWNLIRNSGNLTKQIVILGGEPLHQDKQEFTEFIDIMESELPNHLKILFTGFEINEIDKNILKYFDLIKCGQYKEELKGTNLQMGYELATTNQYFTVNVEADTEAKINRRTKLLLID